MSFRGFGRRGERTERSDCAFQRDTSHGRDQSDEQQRGEEEPGLAIRTRGRPRRSQQARGDQQRRGGHEASQQPAQGVRSRQDEGSRRCQSEPSSIPGQHGEQIPVTMKYEL